MTRGGYRIGAGRKKGFAAFQAGQARELFAETIAPCLEKMIFTLIKKAQTGDVQAARELFDRAWGKLQQTSDISVRNSKPLLEAIQADMKVILNST